MSPAPGTESPGGSAGSPSGPPESKEAEHIDDVGLMRLVLDDPARSALLSDFDGTLAAIVRDPAAARPVDGVPELLGQLATRLGLVGVISGRPAAFLVEHVGRAGPDVELVGLYGLEEVVGGVVHVAPGASKWMSRVAEVAAWAGAEAPPGVVVEDKHATVALHWRTAPDRASWCEEAASRWATETGLVVVPARMAVELRPPLQADKGTAVTQMAQGCPVVVYAGDDAGDIPAFEALDRMAAAGVARVVKVAVADDESPPALATRADIVLPDPFAWVRLLRSLAEALG